MNSRWELLDDLLADLHHARRRGDLGRLAFLAYCDVRRWAREAGRPVLAEQATRLITDSPHHSREDFLSQIDQLIHSLESLQPPAASSLAPAPAPAGNCSPGHCAGPVPA